MGRYRKRLGEVLQQLVQQDQARSIRLQQLGDLGGRRATQIPVLLRNLGEARRPAEPVGELAQQRSDLSVVDV